MNAQTPPSETESELDRIRQVSADARQLANDGKTIFGFLGSLFTMALWVGVAAVAFSFMPQGAKDWMREQFDNLAGMLPNEWIVGLNQMTGLFDGAAFDALREMDPNSEQVTAQLEAMGVTGELQTAVQNNWDDLLTLSQENGGSTSEIITEGVITQLFTNDAHRPLARQIIDALGSVSGNGGDIPDAIKEPLEAFINGEGFEAALNDTGSRELLFEALVEVIDSDTVTVEQLEAAYETLGLTAEQLRPIARTALNGADVDEALQTLLTNPEVLANIAENPEALAAIDPSLAELGPVLGMMTDAGFTTEQIPTILTAMESEGGMQAALTAMFAADATAAKTFLTNTDNLATIASLIPAGEGADNPIVALLQNSEGRTALSQLVTELAAADAQAPKQLLDALSLTDEAARSAAIMRIASDIDSLNALKTFNTNIQGINDPALEELKTQLAPIAGTTAEIAGAAAQAVEEAPQLIAAMEAIASASASDPNGFIGALMDDNTRNALLGEDGSLDALARLMVAQNGESYVTERTTVNGQEGQHRLAALYNLITTIDAGTGGAQGSAEEIRADAENGKAIAFLAAWLSPGSEMETTNSPWSSADKEFRVTTADGQSFELSAQEMEAFFNRHLDVADAQGRPMAMGTAMNNFFADMHAASPAGSAGRELFSFLVDNFWVDRNGDNFVGADEGIKTVFNSADSIGLALSGTGLPIFNSKMRRYGDELTEMQGLMEAFAGELGNLTSPAASAERRDAALAAAV